MEQVKFSWTWQTFGGNPLPYLNCLRDAMNDGSAYPPHKQPYPVGKLQFDSFVAAQGGQAPQTIAQIRNGMAVARPSLTEQPALAFLETIPPGSYFIKPDRGRNGEGIVRLDVSRSSITIDGRIGTLAEIEPLFSSQDYLIQISLVPLQHPAVAALNPEVVNTVRLIVFDTDSGPKPIGALLRVANDAVVDNWERGGVGIPIALDTGVLTEVGHIKRGFRTVRHTKTGASFAGRTVPHWHDAVALACRVHERLAIRTLGWDIGFLRDGPCILEANRTWSIAFAWMVPEILQAFLDYHLHDDPESTVQMELTGDFREGNHVRNALSLIVGRALASGRVEHLSDERLVLTLAGTRTAISTALALTKRRSRDLGLTRIRMSRSDGRIRKGLDVRATFPRAQERYAEGAAHG